MTNMTIYLYDDETGDKIPHRVPAKWEICDCCEGAGRSSAHLGSFTGEQLWELGQDWCEDYFDGRFDEPCADCSGTGKVLVPHAGDGVNPELITLLLCWEQQEREYARWEADDRAVRRAESGYAW